MRKIGRYKRKKQKKLLIVSSLSLLLFLCVGYAAFNTRLNIRAKGNIKQKYVTASTLKEIVVDSGDGLYKDIYEEGKYTYKGGNPNNYIKFNNNLWRILSINNDNTIKIIYEDTLGEMMWADECSDLAYNNIKSTKKGREIKNIIYLAGDKGNCSVTWTQASLQKYLNNDYLSSLSDYEKIISYDWNIGIPNIDYNLSELISSEKGQVWNGKIGLITISEYLRANSNQSMCGIDKEYENREICKATNWLYKNYNWWTITNYTPDRIFYISEDNYFSYTNIMGVSKGKTSNIRPVLYLSPDITLSGTGSASDPYIITN